jgi:hypothetical protein
MFKKLSKYFVAISTLVTMSAAVAPATTFASCTSNIANSIQQGVNSTGANASCGDKGSLTGGINNVAKTITTDFSILIGVISVIMIIYAGFKYVTSGGSSDNANSARNILMYAVIGLIITVIAQLIVHLVINSASKING